METKVTDLDAFQSFAKHAWFATKNPAVDILENAKNWVINDLSHKAPEQLTLHLFEQYVDFLIPEIVRAITVINERDSLIVPSLGLTGEAGEAAEKFKKFLRGDDIDLQSAAPELGDVLFYVAICADRLGVSLSDVAQMEVDKINGRIKRGTRRGEGDNR